MFHSYVSLPEDIYIIIYIYIYNEDISSFGLTLMVMLLVSCTFVSNHRNAMTIPQRRAYCSDRLKPPARYATNLQIDKHWYPKGYLICIDVLTVTFSS